MPSGISSDETLRDLLWRKIRNSKLMFHDIHMYNSLNEGDPEKTYQTLRAMIRRHIERQTEDKMLLEKEKAVKNVANIFQSLKPSGPAPKQKLHLHPMIQRSLNQNHQAQRERRKRRPLSNRPPILRDIQKSKGKEKEMAKTEEEV